MPSDSFRKGFAQTFGTGLTIGASAAQSAINERIKKQAEKAEKETAKLEAQQGFLEAASSLPEKIRNEISNIDVDKIPTDSLNSMTSAMLKAIVDPSETPEQEMETFRQKERFKAGLKSEAFDEQLKSAMKLMSGQTSESPTGLLGALDQSGDLGEPKPSPVDLKVRLGSDPSVTLDIKDKVQQQSEALDLKIKQQKQAAESPEGKKEAKRVERVEKAKDNLDTSVDSSNKVLVALDKVASDLEDFPSFRRGVVGQAVAKGSLKLKDFSADEGVVNFINSVKQELIPLARSIQEEKGPISESDVTNIETGLIGKLEGPLKDKYRSLLKLVNKVEENLTAKSALAEVESPAEDERFAGTFQKLAELRKFLTDKIEASDKLDDPLTAGQVLSNIRNLTSGGTLTDAGVKYLKGRLNES